MLITLLHPDWVYILPVNGLKDQYTSAEEFWQHHGKWVVTGDKAYIMDLAFRLDPLVEAGKIEQAKFTKKDPKTDPLPQVREYALCAYADDRARRKTAGYLSALGVKGFRWKYDSQGITDWSPGGALAEAAARVGRSVDPLTY